MKKSVSSPTLQSLHSNKSKSLVSLKHSSSSSSLNALVEYVDIGVAMNVPLPNLISCSMEQVGQKFSDFQKKEKNVNKNKEDMKEMALCMSTPPELKHENETENETIRIPVQNRRNRRKEKKDNEFQLSSTI